jgi:hypothetical protein
MSTGLQVYHGQLRLRPGQDAVFHKPGVNVIKLVSFVTDAEAK